MRVGTSLIATGVGCLFLATSTCYGATIYACKKKSGGAVRIVGAATACASTEVKISWPNTAETNALKTQAATHTSQIATLDAEIDAKTAGAMSVVVGPTGWQLNGNNPGKLYYFINGLWIEAPLRSYGGPSGKPADHCGTPRPCSVPEWSEGVCGRAQLQPLPSMDQPHGLRW